MSDFGYRLSKKVKVAVGAAKASKPSNGRPRKSYSRSESKEKPVHFESRQANDYDIERRIRFKMENSDMKRKRIYGGRSTEEDSSYSRNRERDRDGSFQRKRGLQGESSEEFIKDRSRKKELQSFRGKNELNLEGDRTWRKVRGRVRSESVSDGKLKPKRRTAERRESVKGRVGSEDVFDDDIRLKTKATSELATKKAGDSEDVLPKKLTRKKTNPNKEFDKGDSNRRQAGPFENSTRKMLRRKKDLEDEPETANGPSKKRKRIRLDPYDVSNKRLDDGISIEGNKIEKKVDVKEKPEVSKNAQFRAIQPSPSILSFVEDNLLGRRRLIELRRAGYNVDLSAPLDNIPFSTSSERERCEESVFRNKLAFFAAANVSSSFPPADLPEIAFAGRSNVGKSSLLNALTRQWGVVRTSDKPGLTQTINFFKLGSKLCLVDLPGYGFAYAKEEVKDAWEELVKEYVSTRVGLKRVCLLIDTKWGMKPRDHELINLMERSQTKYQIVLTKTDMVFPMDLARRAMQIEESLKANKSIVQPLMMVSSKSGAGIRSLRSVLSKISRFVKL